MVKIRAFRQLYTGSHDCSLINIPVTLIPEENMLTCQTRVGLMQKTEREDK